jgi:hypothetical protein
MRRTILGSVIGLALALGACRTDRTEQAAAPAASVADSTVRLGAPLSAAPVVPLTVLANEAARYANQRVRTEGRVTAVCQKAGCWMEIADDTGEAHVRMFGHSFSIPRTATGRRARVAATVLSAPASGECEAEAARQTGKLPVLQLEATGVELL